MFNENLKKLRREKGFSQEQLALRLDVVRQTVSKWEKGYSVPDAALLVKLAEVLDVPVSVLLGKDIEAGQGESSIEALARELAKLNEILVIYGDKASKIKKYIITGFALVLMVWFFGAIFEPWGETWNEFGRNLYHCIND